MNCRHEWKRIGNGSINSPMGTLFCFKCEKCKDQKWLSQGYVDSYHEARLQERLYNQSDVVGGP